mgnify:CR=1 FL=1
MKTLKIKQLLVLILPVIMLTSSCKKYEDGPGVSFKSKKARLTGIWQVIDINGNSNITIQAFEFNANKNYSHSFRTLSGTDERSGSWDWEDKKKSLTITSDGTRKELKILRLTGKEFWFEEEDGDEWRCKKN